MKKIAIVNPELGYAGPDAVAIWMIEALKNKYDLTLITTVSPNLNKLNKFFNSSLDDKIKVKQIYLPKFLRNTSRTRLLKLHLLMRYCKKHKDNYDLFISSYGEMDFGKKGIQYIHYPEVNTEAKLVLKSNFYKESLRRKIYQKLGFMISRYSKENVKSNLTFVNSQWTKEVVDKLYEIESRVVYPPVQDDFEKIDWNDKKDGFVFIGRISPDKRPLEMIKVLKKIREQGYDIHIHILGNEGLDKSYVERVKQEGKKNEWVLYEGKVSRAKLRNIVSHHKYGVSGKKYEHFGIAIAEMINAGCIVFVNDNGGQIEIIGKNEDLIFHSDEDLVNKIIRVLNDKSFQDALQEGLLIQRKKYTNEDFMNDIRRIVRHFLKE